MQGESTLTVLNKVGKSEQEIPVKAYSIIDAQLTQDNVSIPLHVQLGCNQCKPDLESILLQMSCGDKWTLTREQPKQLFTIQIQKIHEGQPPQTDEEFAQDRKKTGNGEIKSKNYENALRSYEQAYRRIEYHADSKVIDLKLSVMSNMALACLNLQRYEQAVKWCQSHLEQTLEPNKKIIYRKAQANKGLRRWTHAREDIIFGLGSFTDEDSQKEFKDLGEAIEKDYKAQLHKEKQLYSKMFG